MDTGRVIARRYLLQRLLKQGQVCAVYQGVDQVLQRVVAVKSVPASSIQAYKAAIQMTSSFSHPNIVGLYDLVSEPETLYVVQEYVEGNDFSSLLQAQISPFEVTDLGLQICQALLYAGSPSRRVSHGDLVPGSVMRNAGGLVRINNLALPSDLSYFQSWSTLGGDGIAVSDTDLPWGCYSEGRDADDTRAVGLLLYQLLAGRPPGVAAVEPPGDGLLRFRRDVPAEVCETVARVVARQHPEHISSVAELYAELKTLVERLELAAPIAVGVSGTGSAYQDVEAARSQEFAPTATGRTAPPLPSRDTENPGLNFPGYPPEQRIILPAPEVAPASPTMADIPLKLSEARRAAYGVAGHSQGALPREKRRSPVLLILLLGLLLFVLFFVIGYFAGLWIIP